MINLRRTLLPGTMLLAVQAFALPALGQQCDHDSTPITASPGPGGQSVVTDQSVVADPNLAAGPEGRGSKLATLDLVVIDAPVALSLPGNPAGTSVCYSISNSTPQSYFVPWNTPSEWSAFLQAIGASHQLSALLDTAPPPANASWINGISVSLCCPEQQVGTICQAEGGPLVSTSELGYRYKGTPSGDIPSWAAEGDVYGPVYAADVAGNPNLNYRVTFVCQNGAWVKTHEEGSCVPTPGQCAPGSAGLTALPSDLTTLCAAGSIFGGLTNTGGAGPWTWTCLGTPGQADASCSSAASGCGPANATVDMSPAAPAAGTLCAGTSTLAASPVLTTGAPPAWTWTCKDNSSGLSASCSAISDASPPACGSAAGGMYAIAPSDPAALCQSGTPSNVIIYNWFGSVLWGWQCTDSVGGGTVCTASVLNSGQCGSANGVASSSVPVDLCAAGNTPSPVLDINNTWTWQCAGTNPGAINATCSAPANLVATNSDFCGTANGTLSPSPPSANLCASGALATSVVDSGNGQWTWTCVSGGTPSICAATNTTEETTTAQGICGSANRTAIPDVPNINLCAAGTPSTVTGSGPWSWTCQGASSGANCRANICQVCAGTVTATVNGPATIGTLGGCTVRGYSTWTETDVMSAANADETLQWSDPFHGAFSTVIGAAAASPATYCPPCYQTAQSVTNAQVVVQAAQGSCPGNSALNSGQPVSYSATGVTLTPQ